MVGSYFNIITNSSNSMPSTSPVRLSFKAIQVVTYNTMKYRYFGWIAVADSVKQELDFDDQHGIMIGSYSSIITESSVDTPAEMPVLLSV